MVLSVVSVNLCSFLAQEQFYSIRYQFLESLATTDLNLVSQNADGAEQH